MHLGFPRGVAGSLTNPDTPGGQDGGEANPAEFKAQAVKRLLDGGKGPT